MARMDFYTEAHLVIAAIRMVEYQKKTPPSIDDICKALSYTLEHGNRICRKLFDMQAIHLIEGAYGSRLHILDHLKLEDIPRGEEEDRLSDELKKFQASRDNMSEKIDLIKAEQAEKKKSLFAELDKQLKENVDRKS
ncbi:MAG: hypothetical protein V3S89_16025 [Desulfobacterales bacterium]